MRIKAKPKFRIKHEIYNNDKVLYTAQMSRYRLGILMKREWVNIAGLDKHSNIPSTPDEVTITTYRNISYDDIDIVERIIKLWKDRIKLEYMNTVKRVLYEYNV